MSKKINSKVKITTQKFGQLSFIPKASKEFGGSLLIGKRKVKRILSFSKPMHFVFKSENAKNSLAFVRFQKQIIELMKNVSRICGIKVYDMAVNFNHIHLVVLLSNDDSYKKWIRHLTSAIVAMMSKVVKTNLTKFFTLRPYSRIVDWGRQFKTVLNYQILNQLEVVGLRQRVKAKVKLKSLSRELSFV